ncbi:hypothetical protein LWI29_009300 [Acer saccharum]|uniref:Uncharacterized protein n=1 Tax=Acer saccharum TaxID=4024 RepID=A0AA39T4H6_ACESA|nr:hypothetical protein LWI29_009300 [Acer saccharum]
MLVNGLDREPLPTPAKSRIPGTRESTRRPKDEWGLGRHGHREVLVPSYPEYPDTRVNTLAPSVGNNSPPFNKLSSSTQEKIEDEASILPRTACELRASLPRFHPEESGEKERNQKPDPESVRLRMIAKGIPFESPRFAEGAGPSTQVPIFDKPGPPLLVQNHPEDLRHRLVKSAIYIPPRKGQSTTRPAARKRDPQPDVGGSTGSWKDQ